MAFYDYEDEQGRPLYQVVRFEPKGFSQRRPFGDGWAWGVTEDVYVRGKNGDLYLPGDASNDAERVSLEACRLVLYRLPKIVAAVKAGLSVHIVEGEEDVHALEAAWARRHVQRGRRGQVGRRLYRGPGRGQGFYFARL